MFFRSSAVESFGDSVAGANVLLHLLRLSLSLSHDR